MSEGRKKVAIIGAGVCGVSTAICLQNANSSLDLTIIAEKFSPHTTSDGGAGLWSSDPGFWMTQTLRDKQRQWGKATFEYLKSIVDADEAFKYEIVSITGYFLYDQMMPQEPPLKDVCLYYERLSKEKLRKLSLAPDIIDGFTMKSFVFPGTPFLQMKLKQFQEKGGKVVQRKVVSFDELAEKFDVVVNCSGLGSCELCKDDKIEPARGHILRMHAPWVNHFYYVKRKKELAEGKLTYIFPRFKDVVIGGTAQRGNWSTDVDHKETQAILDKVCEFEPSIKNASIINQWVGLRPARNAVRLEKELMDVKTVAPSQNCSQTSLTLTSEGWECMSIKEKYLN